MKNLKIVLAIGLVFLSGKSATAQNLDTSSSSEIGAQVAVTKRAIDLVIEKYSGSVVPTGVKAQDYFDTKIIFEKRLESALLHFEDGLKNDILANRAGSVMMNFNSVYNSTSFSPEQKNLILQQQRAFIENQATVISKVYAQLINQVFNELGFPRIQLVRAERVVDSKKDFRDCIDLDTRDYEHLKGSRVNIGKAFSADNKEIACVVAKSNYEIIAMGSRLMALELRKDCRSQVCVDMRASDAMVALTLLKSLFGRRIDLKLADNQTVLSITPPPFLGQTHLNALAHPEFFGIEDLPFDAPVGAKK